MLNEYQKDSVKAFGFIHTLNCLSLLFLCLIAYSPLTTAWQESPLERYSLPLFVLLVHSDRQYGTDPLNSDVVKGGKRENYEKNVIRELTSFDYFPRQTDQVVATYPVGLFSGLKYFFCCGGACEDEEEEEDEGEDEKVHPKPQPATTSTAQDMTVAELPGYNQPFTGQPSTLLQAQCILAEGNVVAQVTVVSSHFQDDKNEVQDDKSEVQATSDQPPSYHESVHAYPGSASNMPLTPLPEWEAFFTDGSPDSLYFYADWHLFEHQITHAALCAYESVFTFLQSDTVTIEGVGTLHFLDVHMDRFSFINWIFTLAKMQRLVRVHLLVMDLDRNILCADSKLAAPTVDTRDFHVRKKNKRCVPVAFEKKFRELVQERGMTKFLFCIRFTDPSTSYE